MTSAARAIRYFDYNGLPAYWGPNNRLRLVRPGGSERAIIELWHFAHGAVEITKEEFDALKKSLG